MANCLFDFNQKEEKKEYAYSCVRLGMATQKKDVLKIRKITKLRSAKANKIYKSITKPLKFKN